jgi:hypothetical protein
LVFQTDTYGSPCDVCLYIAHCTNVLFADVHSINEVCPLFHVVLALLGKSDLRETWYCIHRTKNE